MQKIKWIFSKQMLFMLLLAYYFLGYYYPTYFVNIGVYNYLEQYLGAYQIIFNIFLILYGFSLIIKNPKKIFRFRMKIYAMVILSVACGYLYLLQNIQLVDLLNMKKVYLDILEVGLVDNNMGYIVIYTFFSVLEKFKLQIQFLYGLLLGIAGICGMIVIGNDILIWLLTAFSNYAKRRAAKKEAERKSRLKKKKLKMEKEVKRHIQKMQKKYGDNRKR